MPRKLIHGLLSVLLSVLLTMTASLTQSPAGNLLPTEEIQRLQGLFDEEAGASHYQVRLQQEQRQLSQRPRAAKLDSSPASPIKSVSEFPLHLEHRISTVPAHHLTRAPPIPTV